MTPTLALHLQTLEGNPGILPIKEGQAYYQTDYWTIVKVINLERIYSDLNYVSMNYEQLCKLIDWNTSYSEEFKNVKIHTEFIRDITIDKYRQLVPQQRFKRGLINPLGSIIKVITGNLDHDDAIKYDKLTSELSHNQIIVSKKLTLVSKMFDSFINVTETMNQNTVNLDNRLKQAEIMLRDLAARKNNWVFFTYISGLFSVFTSSFRTIFIRLSEIETALALSRVSILHQSIVNSTELMYHLKLIANSESLVYLPIDENLLKLEETICVKSFIKKNQITFIMEIPITDNCTYNYFKMYSLPIFHQSENKTLSIFPEYPYLLAKGMKYLSIVKPCRPLSTGDHFLCNADNRAMYHEPTCIEQLMKFDDNPDDCTQHQVQIENVKVQQVSSDSWIIFSKFKTTLTKHCDNEVSKQPLFGSYLVTIDEPCDLEINGIRIRHRIYIESDVVKPIPIIILPQLRANANLSGARALNMKGVHLDEVKYMAYSLKHSAVIESVLNEQKDLPSLRLNFSEQLGYVTLCLVILSFLMFLLYVFRLKLLKILPLKKNYRNTSKIDRTDNFPLRDGGVMVTPHPSALD